MPEGNNDPQLNLEEVVEVAPESLSDGQKSFLEEHKEDLTDEQAETFGIEREPKPPEDTEPEVRSKVTTPKKDEEPTPSGGDEVDPDDEATIGRVVDRKLKPFTEQRERETQETQEIKNQVEVDSFIRENPEYKGYREKMLIYARHPDYSNAAIRNLALIVSGEDSQKLGAQKEREAREEADKTKGAGSSARTPKGGEKDWSGATQEEMDAKKAEVLDRRV